MTTDTEDSHNRIASPLCALTQGCEGCLPHSASAECANHAMEMRTGQEEQEHAQRQADTKRHKDCIGLGMMIVGQQQARHVGMQRAGEAPDQGHLG